MINSRFVLALVGAVSVLFVDFAQVQAKSNKEPIFKKPLLFRRAKEYQREQLKQELKGELYAELSDKLDKDVAVATETLRKATEAKVAAESKKLQSQARAHSQKLTADSALHAKSLDASAKAHASTLSKQYADAAKTLDAQGKAILEANAKFQDELTLAHEQALERHAQANKRARNRLVSMFKTLTQEFQTESQEQAKANEKMIADLATASEKTLSARVEELAKTLAKQNDAFAAELGKKLSKENQSSLALTKVDLEQALADLSADLMTQVDKAVAQITAQQAEPEQAPEPQPVPEDQEAIPATPVNPQKENSEDE